MDTALLWKASSFQVVYAREPFPASVKKTVFLAGPTPRQDGIPSWRPEALKHLQALGFDGHVFLPEPKDGKWLADYDGQIEWEEEALNRSDVIVFWVPREVGPMTALTTNIEWGMWQDSGKVIWSAPDWAKHTRYPEYYAKKLGVQTANELRQALFLAVERLGAGALREGGETQVPLHVWQKKEFQSWLSSQKAAGNRLDGARVLWAFFTKSGFLFSYVVHVNVHVASENRNKVNEWVLFRSDISSVLLHHEDKVVLVREFRSPVRNEEGFIYELPGGSSFDTKENALQVASSEVHEETGLMLDPKRFKKFGARQLTGTLSSHVASLYTCELTAEEIAHLEADKSPHGNFVTDSEMTFIEVRTLAEIQANNLVDWTTLGMILAALKA